MLFNWIEWINLNNKGKQTINGVLTRIYELIVFVQLHMVHYTVFTVFRLLTDFVCLYTYEFWLSLCKIVRSSVILLLLLYTKHFLEDFGWVSGFWEIISYCTNLVGCSHFPQCIALKEMKILTWWPNLFCFDCTYWPIRNINRHQTQSYYPTQQ